MSEKTCRRIAKCSFLLLLVTSPISVILDLIEGNPPIGIVGLCMCITMLIGLLLENEIKEIKTKMGRNVIE